MSMKKIFAVLWVIVGGLFSLHAQPAAVQQFQNVEIFGGQVEEVGAFVAVCGFCAEGF